MRCWRGILVSGFGFTWNMSWRSWSGEFIERVVAFHVKHCGVGRFAGWLFESVVSSLLVVGGWCFTWNSCGYGFGGVVGNWRWGF